MKELFDDVSSMFRFHEIEQRALADKIDLDIDEWKLQKSARNMVRGFLEKSGVEYTDNYENDPEFEKALLEHEHRRHVADHDCHLSPEDSCPCADK